MKKLLYEKKQENGQIKIYQYQENLTDLWTVKIVAEGEVELTTDGAAKIQQQLNLVTGFI